MALTDQRGMDPVDPADAEFFCVHLPDQRGRRGVTDRPRRRRAGLGGIEGAPGDLQDLAERLDPKTVLVLVDVTDDHFRQRSSPAAAKDADAVRRISFARRSSRFSRSGSAIGDRRASSLLHPGRSSVSSSAWVTEFAHGLGVDPQLLGDPGQRSRPRG
ncbi:hypothetical protein GCM10010972_34600 [Cellulomonas carbonis]|uniref:Uncharacterized protein n=1 Tax=Cellulomonas carbonis T26 TaxID=947969 RepID=A0A0A0BQ41_9CELL|nr:hypothetical protein N868_16735 [Cellulomonas carbonis T26]GGC18428.1 hypothetical protein GCM10010972_34600 [Cellulomonas carbonis]